MHYPGTALDMSEYSCLNLSKFKSTMHHNNIEEPQGRCETAQHKYSDQMSDNYDKGTQIMFGASALGQSALC